MDFSVSQINPPLEDDSERGGLRLIDGFGNYHLRVYGAAGSVLSNITVLDLFSLDSGDRETVQGRQTYGWIKDSQLSWRFKILLNRQDSLTSKQCLKQNMENVPSNPDPALAFFHIPIPEVRDLWYTPLFSQFQEGVAYSIVQSGVLNIFLSMGNVKAAFIGHDHVNDFCGNLKGVWFCYGGVFGYHAYAWKKKLAQKRETDRH
ncbi:unnamed protein product [Eruca vesicaria subsp. sativa]|uniref:Uncharacterized protein n=1 Tax=Eruca vesicaria subsp. sativa TaxID=29727 RepID=A0ABC8KA59_ERUVS|nr:unnamed protein product [Eruca vesicaria subsp. sativa]